MSRFLGKSDTEKQILPYRAQIHKNHKATREICQVVGFVVPNSEVLYVDQASDGIVCRVVPLCHVRDKIRNSYGGSSKTNLQELAGLQ